MVLGASMYGQFRSAVPCSASERRRHSKVPASRRTSGSGDSLDTQPPLRSFPVAVPTHGAWSPRPARVVCDPRSVESGEPVRLKLTLHYDGSRFHGWQIQPGVRTVQRELEAALERLTGARRTVTGSGRTDRGVHARGQVASVVVPSRWTAESLREAMNAVLPDDVWVSGSEVVSADFHPRFHAVARTYRYRLGTAPEAWSPFHRPWCWPLDDEPDREVLDRMAADLPGEHSFRAFAKSGQPDRGDRCRVDGARWETQENGIGPVFRITADRYLHRMVRYLVGTMVEAGWGRRPPGDLGAMLEDPGCTLVTSAPAPPEGLFLERVEYRPGAVAGTDAEVAGTDVEVAGTDVEGAGTDVEVAETDVVGDELDGRPAREPRSREAE